MEKDYQALNKEYDRIFSNMEFGEVIDKLKGMKNDINYEDYACFLCDEILQVYTSDYTHYPDKLTDYDKEWRSLYKNAVGLFSIEEYYYLAVNAFFDNNRNDLKKYIKLRIKDQVVDKKQKINEIIFVLDYVVIFKNAYPEFYNMFADVLEEYGIDKDIVDLCRIMEQYYRSKDVQDIMDMMLPFSISHTKLILPKELIGLCYYDMKMWNNALAYFEQVEEKTVLIYSNNLCFVMAWCYGKAKLYLDEEKYYRKSVELFPYQAFARNNLGYSFYKQKRYGEAIKLFEECFELNLELDIKYASNNYVRTLIAMGLNKDACAFVESGKYKISKSIRDRLKKTDGKNHKTSEKKEDKFSNDLDENDESNEIKSPTDFLGKTEQFSSERILEDELTARIEAGQPVFGLNLKVWRRKGEYGRQYMLPTGKRIDLLCEDNKGDIYVIEFRK